MRPKRWRGWWLGDYITSWRFDIFIVGFVSCEDGVMAQVLVRDKELLRTTHGDLKYNTFVSHETLARERQRGHLINPARG